LFVISAEAQLRMRIHWIKLTLVVVFVSGFCAAQQSRQSELSSAPSSTIPLLTLAHADPGSTVYSAGAALPLTTAAIPFTTRDRKVVNKAFIAWTVADAATIAADAYTTVHCLNLPNCIEKNPLFGSHPSAARVAATESAFLATDTLVSYWLKRKGKSWWWVPALANTAQGAIAVGLNLRHR
jgi:hypothetical protein